MFSINMELNPLRRYADSMQRVFKTRRGLGILMASVLCATLVDLKQENRNPPPPPAAPDNHDEDAEAVVDGIYPRPVEGVVLKNLEHWRVVETKQGINWTEYVVRAKLPRQNEVQPPQEFLVRARSYKEKCGTAKIDLTNAVNAALKGYSEEPDSKQVRK